MTEEEKKNKMISVFTGEYDKENNLWVDYSRSLGDLMGALECIRGKSFYVQLVFLPIEFYRDISMILRIKSLMPEKGMFESKYGYIEEEDTNISMRDALFNGIARFVEWYNENH